MISQRDLLGMMFGVLMRGHRPSPDAWRQIGVKKDRALDLRDWVSTESGRSALRNALQEDLRVMEVRARLRKGE